MGTLSSALSIAAGALNADQGALNVVANNTANVSTPGYTREVAQWQENDPVTINGTSYGTGVTMTGGASQRDRVLEQRIQQQGQAESGSSARLTALDQVQTIFNQLTTANGPGGGIGQNMSRFFDSLTALGATPADNSLRQGVLSAANALASSFNSASAQLTGQQRGLDQQSVTIVGQVNALTGSIAQLDQQISSASPTGDAGALEDQRQQDLTQLSHLVGISQIRTEDNGLTITTASGALLVSKGAAFKLSTGQVGGATHIFDASGNDITSQLPGGGGQLGGIFMVRDQDIPQMQSSLDTLAYAIGSQMNTINQAGADANGAAGTAIFSTLPPPAPSTGEASRIAVTMTDPAKIAAAGAGLGPADNSNVTKMADLQSAAVAGGTTPTNFYSSFVSTLGSLISNVTTENTAQQASLAQLQNQRNSLSAVNLNEEAASLEGLQNSYNAASKVFTILDTLMSSAINLGVATAV